MKDKPILFSTPMVQAILAGDKTQTRRAVVPQPKMDDSEMWHWKDCQWMNGGTGMPESAIADYAPYKSGDILWVREPHRFIDYQYIDGVWSAQVLYKTPYYNPPRLFWREEEVVPDIGWRPSIHMPRKAARLFLRATNVRADRVQDISTADAFAEGFDGPCSRYAFSKRWDELNAKRGYGWAENPWVWVIEFERIEKPEGA